MKPVVFKEVSKIWNTISVGNQLNEVDLELEIHKKLLNIFQVGDYYYYIFNLKNLQMEFMSKEMETVLGYKTADMDLTSLFNKIHPEDQPWFLNIENKAVEFLSKLSVEQVPNYKVRYDYRIQKSDGQYMRILQQVITLQYSETGGILKTLGVHTDISHLKMEGKPVLSFIGLNGEPSFIDVDIKEVFETSSGFLSARECEILSLLIGGKETKEIATLLFISPSTVSTHRKNLLAKTKARNTSEMISMAITKGWV
jgi:DNA-binding CsgD family transcriptional regulator